MTFAEKIMEVKKTLEEKGFEVLVPLETEELAEAPHNIDAFKQDFENGEAVDIMKKNFDEVAKADVLLVLNFDKKGIQGYIGTSVLMELGLAYYLGKKLYLWQDIPQWEEVSWAYEVRLLQPHILNGDLSKVL